MEDAPMDRQTQPGPRQGHAQAGGLVPAGSVPSVKCKATNRAGLPCGRWALVGALVCATHGGSAPQVREAARERILTFAPAAIQRLQYLALHADSEAVAVRALIDLLDRAGLKAADELSITAPASTNADLDAAILGALVARGHVVDVASDQGMLSPIALPEAPDLQ